jgi:hypothetical protein
VQRVLVLVQVVDEVDDAALVVEAVGLAGRALVGEVDAQAPGEERGLAHPLRERLVVVVDLLEDLGVRCERDGRAGLLRRLALLQIALRLAPRVVLRPDVAVAADLEVE